MKEKGEVKICRKTGIVSPATGFVGTKEGGHVHSWRETAAVPSDGCRRRSLRAGAKAGKVHQQGWPGGFHSGSSLQQAPALVWGGWLAHLLCVVLSVDQEIQEASNKIDRMNNLTDDQVLKILSKSIANLTHRLRDSQIMTKEVSPQKGTDDLAPACSPTTAPQVIEEERQYQELVVFLRAERGRQEWSEKDLHQLTGFPGRDLRGSHVVYMRGVMGRQQPSSRARHRA